MVVNITYCENHPRWWQETVSLPDGITVEEAKKELRRVFMATDRTTPKGKCAVAWGLYENTGKWIDDGSGGTYIHL